MASKAQAALNVVVSIGPKVSEYTTPTVTITGTTSVGSPSVTAVSSTVGLSVGMPVSGTGIAAGSIISAIGSGTLTLSKQATAAGTGVTLTVTVFAAIGEVSSAPTSGYKWDLEEVTSFDSGENKEFLKTLLDSGKWDLEFNRVSTNGGQQALKAAFLDTEPYMFQVALPTNVDETTSGDSTICAGLVIDYDDTVTIGKAIKLKTSIQRTGTPTYTQGS